MSAAATRRPFWKRALRVLALLLLLMLLLLLAWAGSVWLAMVRSTPRAEGSLAVPGLSAPVSIARDAEGVPVVRGETRADVARALGFLHAQERFFQMDTLRRSAAGELSELFGPATIGIDETVRRHAFRERAKAIVAAMGPGERAILDAYVEGVNSGLADLGSRPFEYRLLFARPSPWQGEDTVLAVYAMYLNLQPATPRRELHRLHATARLGPGWADFLLPSTTPLDAPIDGSTLPEPAMPTAMKPVPAPSRGRPSAGEIDTLGSNNWAVSGARSSSGAGLVANDMHLGLSVPGTWVRARLIVSGAAEGETALDATGVTLPGTPFIVAGSTGRIAWGFTNSYIDTADAVIVDETRPGFYRTAEGEKPFVTRTEQVRHRTGTANLDVHETIWGPVVGKDALGRTIAMRWTAHFPDAVKIGPFLALERAASVEEAIAIAHQGAIPQQNFVVADAAGNIGWTIIGQVPDRFGFDGQDPASFADGNRGWRGQLPADAVPVVMNPEGGRIWTANTRVIGGNGFPLLGDGGYDTGARAGRIRDLLMARDSFAPADFLAIQLDDVNVRNRWWQALLLDELEARKSDPALAALIPFVRDWGERAVPGSVGYRLVARFRSIAVESLYEAYLGRTDTGGSYAPSQAEGPARRLLAERPEALRPPGATGWEDFLDRVLADLAAEVKAEAGGNPARFAWGDVGKAGVRHPLTRLFPFLSRFTDPLDVAVPGDRATVRAQAPGFGASERFAVSPGHEADGLFHMPGSPSGNPRAPWYLAGHQAWVEGKPTPFLPGPARWEMTLTPAQP